MSGRAKIRQRFVGRVLKGFWPARLEACSRGAGCGSGNGVSRDGGVGMIVRGGWPDALPERAQVNLPKRSRPRGVWPGWQMHVFDA